MLASIGGIEADLGWAPGPLADLLFARALMQSASSPMFGFLADSTRVRRLSMIAIGCAGWGVST